LVRGGDNICAGSEVCLQNDVFFEENIKNVVSFGTSWCNPEKTTHYYRWNDFQYRSLCLDDAYGFEWGEIDRYLRFLDKVGVGDFFMDLDDDLKLEKNNILGTKINDQNQNFGTFSTFSNLPIHIDPHHYCRNDNKINHESSTSLLVDNFFINLHPLHQNIEPNDGKSEENISAPIFTSQKSSVLIPDHILQPERLLSTYNSWWNHPFYQNNLFYDFNLENEYTFSTNSSNSQNPAPSLETFLK